MATRRGKTVITQLKPKVISFASAVGKKEGQGPLSKEFDEIYEDTTMGEDSWEKAESLYLKAAISKAELSELERLLPKDAAMAVYQHFRSKEE